MPVVVGATMTAKPESVDTVREACEKAADSVHSEPGCDLYSLRAS
jgi:quinol monooxygenase YgiN